MGETSNRKVLACVLEAMRRWFLAEPLKSRDWPFEIEYVTGAIGTEGLLNKLRETRVPVLMSCWGMPKLPDDLRAKAPDLKYIAHLCGEVRQWLPRRPLEEGLLLTNWGSTISRSVAEHTLLQILACLRRIAHWQLEMHVRKGWDADREGVRGLFHRRVGIHGFGNISRELVKLLAPFDCEISTYSPSVSDADLAALGVKRAASLRQLFSENEVIVELAARTPANINSVTEELLMLIPEGGVFVNTGRGAVVDEAALIRVAQTGRIQVALDVYQAEPLPPDSPLRGLDNVMLTPHIGGPTPDRRQDAGMMALTNIEAFFAGQPMQMLVGVKEYDRMT